MKATRLLAVLILAFCACNPITPAKNQESETVWVDPIVKVKLGDAAMMNLETELRSCASTKADLPASCKAAGEFITIATTPSIANCHWQCGSPCSDTKCLWEVKAGTWSLRYRRLAVTERVKRKACDESWQATLDDPKLYEETSCEAECFQMSAVKSLSRINPACAMEVSGAIAMRPVCSWRYSKLVRKWCA